MRTSKSILAGLAAGALGIALVPVMATGAQASTVYGISVGVPSMTLVAGNATIKPLIPLSYTENGNPSALGAGEVITVAITKDDTPATGSTASTFKANAVAATGTTGLFTFELATGDDSSNFTSIPTGTYRLSAVVTVNGVGVASNNINLTVVSTAASSAVPGTSAFVTEQSLAASAASPLVVATDDSISLLGTRYAAFLNSTGGPIVGAPALFSIAATGTSTGTQAFAVTPSVAAAAPGVYAFNLSGQTAYKWPSTPGSGALVSGFASPVNQVSGTLAVNVAATTTISGLDITSAVEGAAVPPTTGTIDDSASIPTTNGVKFSVKAITNTTVGGVQTPTAGIPVTLTVQQVDDSNATASGTSYSSISPALPVSLTSAAGGVVSQEYTVSNPVANRGVRITLAYPGGTSKVFLVQFKTPTVYETLVATSPVTASTTGNVTLAAAVYDQFGDPLANWPVQASITGTAATSTPASLTTNAAGEVTYTYAVPAGTLPGAISNVNFAAWNGSAFATSGSPLFATVAVNYTSGSAAVSSLTTTGSFNPAAPVYVPLTNNALNTAANPMFINTAVNTANVATVANNGYAWSASVVARNTAGATIAGAPVTVTASEGGVVQNPATGRWATSATVYTSGSGVAQFVMASTKTGTITYSIASGDAKGEAKAVFANRASDARTVSVTSSAAKIPAGSGATITALVTDRFGNPVANVPVSFTESGPGYIGGSGTGTTGADGKLEATYVTVMGQEGAAAITATVATTANVPMPNALPSASAQTYTSTNPTLLQVSDTATTVTSYNVPRTSNTATPDITATVASVAAGVASNAVAVEVEGGSVTRSIAITGARATVSGKPGIKIEGLTTGLVNGKTVIPYFRFPGETSYTQGTARPVIEDEAFTWQRKTGKKFYAYVTNDDGLVQSNRVIIAAN